LEQTPLGHTTGVDPKYVTAVHILQMKDSRDAYRLQAAVKLAWISRALFILAATFTRLSLLFFYYRLTTDAIWMRGFRWLLHASVFSVTTVGVVTLILSVFQCK
jgi:hypothetical protein